jgi:1,4-alpha-glucan branching enzyme
VRHDDGQRCLVAFVRRGGDAVPPLLVVSNLTPTVHRGLRLGVPQAGTWVERLNTDSAHYGGSNVGTPLGQARSDRQPCDGRVDSIVIDLPPLATVFLEWTA